MLLFDQLFKVVDFQRPHLGLGGLVDARQLADAGLHAVLVDLLVVGPLIRPFGPVLVGGDPVVLLPGDRGWGFLGYVDHVPEPRAARLGGQFLVFNRGVEKIHVGLFGLVVIRPQFAGDLGLYLSCVG